MDELSTDDVASMTTPTWEQAKAAIGRATPSARVELIDRARRSVAEPAGLLDQLDHLAAVVRRPRAGRGRRRAGAAHDRRGVRSPPPRHRRGLGLAAGERPGQGDRPGHGRQLRRPARSTRTTRRSPFVPLRHRRAPDRRRPLRRRRRLPGAAGAGRAARSCATSCPSTARTARSTTRCSRSSGAAPRRASSTRRGQPGDVCVHHVYKDVGAVPADAYDASACRSPADRPRRRDRQVGAPSGR